MDSMEKKQGEKAAREEAGEVEVELERRGGAQEPEMKRRMKRAQQCFHFTL